MSTPQRSRKVVDLRNVKPRSERPRLAIKKESGQKHAQVQHKRKRKIPLKQRRAYRRRGILYASVAIVVLGCVGLGTLTFSSALAVRTVSVTGIRTLNETQVQAEVMRSLTDTQGFFFSRNTIFTASTSTIEAALKTAFPQINDVQVHRGGFHALSVEINEREPFVWWCVDEGHEHCFDADSNGFIYKQVDQLGEEKKPVVRGGVSDAEHVLSTTITADSFERVRAYINAFSKLDIAVTQYHISDDGMDITISSEDVPDVIVLLHDDAQKVARMIQAALHSEPLRKHIHTVTYIDARYGNRLYYKMSDEVTKETDVDVQTETH